MRFARLLPAFKLRRFMLLQVFSFLCLLGMTAQSAPPKEPFVSYSFNLLPDTRGTLNARGSIGLNWTAWLSSDLSAFTDNYTNSLDTASDVSTVVSSGRTIALTILRVDDDLLWTLLKKKLEFIKFSAGIRGAYDWTEQKQYGYDPSQALPVFYIDESVKTVLRPLQSYSLGFKLGPVLVGGKFESTIYWSTEAITSTHFTSAMTAAPAAVAIEYDGGETLAGGDLEVNLRVVNVIGGVEYYRHIMTDGTKANTSMSETWTYRGALQLSFLHLAGGSPVIGASFVNKSDYFVIQDKNIVTSTVRLEVGLRY